MDINCIVQNGQWETLNLDAKGVLNLCCRQLGLEQGGEVAIVLTDDATIQPLNAQFRGQDKPTNVLSFPSEMPEELGDILLAYETLMREAEQQGKHPENHATHLLIHGFLHLLGYDHQNVADACEMESLEIAILSQLAIANPYESS